MPPSHVHTIRSKTWCTHIHTPTHKAEERTPYEEWGETLQRIRSSVEQEHQRETTDHIPGVEDYLLDSRALERIARTPFKDRDWQLKVLRGVTKETLGRLISWGHDNSDFPTNIRYFKYQKAKYPKREASSCTWGFSQIVSCGLWHPLFSQTNYQSKSLYNQLTSCQWMYSL